MMDQQQQKEQLLNKQTNDTSNNDVQLKIFYESGDIHRLSMATPSTFEELTALVRETFELAADTQFQIAYMDDEEDTITISTIKEFVYAYGQLNPDENGKKLLKLMVTTDANRNELDRVYVELDRDSSDSDEASNEESGSGSSSGSDSDKKKKVGKECKKRKCRKRGGIKMGFMRFMMGWRMAHYRRRNCRSGHHHHHGCKRFGFFKRHHHGCMSHGWSKKSGCGKGKCSSESKCENEAKCSNETKYQQKCKSKCGSKFSNKRCCKGKNNKCAEETQESSQDTAQFVQTEKTVERKMQDLNIYPNTTTMN